MSDIGFTSDDWDRYEAGEMTLEQLRFQTADHPEDCDCHYCYAKEIKEAGE